ncbi:MAG: 23S rRNA (uracil(1939)-C(5))-methyltransferase RlmD [Chloroflexi bacterium]|nr:23S rRNA (uracil(1939)-C(5))-methyltransferase RlmD [Chloroflexota bacterium]
MSRSEPASPERHETSLERVAHGGECVGRAGDLVAFVAYGLPGERVAFDVTERKARFVRGRVAEVLDAAPERVTAPCPIFGTCGGCHWQHATYEAQLQFKTGVLREQLERGGKFAEPPIEDAVPSPLVWHYRNTVQFVPGEIGPDGEPVAASRHEAASTSSAARREGSRLLCFQRAHSHAVVPVEHCYISDELINRTIHATPWHVIDDATWRALENIVVRVVPGEAVQITFVATSSIQRSAIRRFVDGAPKALPELRGILMARARGGRTYVRWGEESLEYTIAGCRLSVPAGAFVQVNLGATERLIELLLQWLDLGQDDVVLDAYAGAGTLALALARKVHSVIAVESQPAAAAAAAQNAAANGLMNVLAREASLEAALPRLGSKFDVAVLDPPRRGCSPEALAGLIRLSPRQIAYISCEPSTLARDLRVLTDAGYSLRRTRVVDFFPQTYHLESVSQLVRD